MHYKSEFLYQEYSIKNFNLIMSQQTAEMNANAVISYGQGFGCMQLNYGIQFWMQETITGQTKHGTFFFCDFKMSRLSLLV